jgi:GNAT superfamily N-acetyltransferase
MIGKIRKRGWSTRRSVLVACELAHLRVESSVAPQLEVSFLDPAAFPDLPSTLPDARNHDLLSLAAMERTRAEGAGELVVARYDGELAGIHFIHTAAHQERLERVAPRLYAPLQAGEALTEGVFVFPAFRGRGVGSSMLRASASELARRGYHRGLAMIDVGNRASLRAFAAAGFTAQPTMRLDSHRLGRRTSRFVAVDSQARRRYLEATAGIEPSSVPTLL